MIIRMFKPGDRVQRKSGGPVMIVQRYAREFSPLVGWYESNYLVECSYYRSDGYQREVIHQNNLIKSNPAYAGAYSQSAKSRLNKRVS